MMGHETMDAKWLSIADEVPIGGTYHKPIVIEDDGDGNVLVTWASGQESTFPANFIIMVKERA